MDLPGLKAFLDLLVVTTNLKTTLRVTFLLSSFTLFLILPLVIGGSADTHHLSVDQTVVSLGVPVGQVAGLGGEGLLDAPLLQQEAARLTDDGPGDVRGNHDGYFLLQMGIFIMSVV